MKADKPTKHKIQGPIIRSSIVSLGSANQIKREALSDFIDEYKRVMILFANILWSLNKIAIKLDNSLTSQIKDSWLSARAIQAAGKQASGVVRGTRKKQNQMTWKINDLKSKGEFKKARKLQLYFNEKLVSKPALDNIQPELDSRFCDISLEQNATSFDGWIKLRSLGNKLKIDIPFKRHKHFNNMLQKGKIKTGIRLGKKNITLMFELPEVTKRADGSVIGIDIGIKTTFSLSDNQVINTGNHGWTYDTICEKLSRQIRGSKNFEQTVKHRSNYIHEMVNEIDLTNIRQINRENIRGLRKYHNTSRKLKHFNYAEVFEVLDNRLMMEGVLPNKVSPTYTSQRCSACGWVLKANRKGKYFRCKSCSFELDADLNASRNLALPLRAISKKQRLKQENRIGFYWTVLSEEFTVPHPKKVNSNCALSKTQCGYQPSIT